MRGYWYDRPLVRFGILIGFCSAILAAGGVYFSMGEVPDVPVYHVMSSGVLESGEDASLRISGRMLDSREGVDVAVDDVQVGGSSVLFRTKGEDPVVVDFEVPFGLDVATSVRIDVGAKGRGQALEFPVDLRRPDRRATTVLEEGALPKTDDPFHINIVPNELVMGMKNRFFVLIRDPKGRPAQGVDVTLKSHSLDTQGKTNDWGVMEVFIEDPMHRFDIRVSVTDGLSTAQTWEPIRSIGRGIMLRQRERVNRIGLPFKIEIETREESLRVFCELRQGGVWRKGWITETRGHLGWLDIPGLAAGLYHAQCASHPLKSGNAVATLPVVVGDETAHVELRSLIREHKILLASSVPKLVGGRESDPLTQAFWIASLREGEIGSQRPILVSTEAAQKTRMNARRGSLNAVLLFVGVLMLLLLAWVTEIVARHMIRSRARYRALAMSEDPASPDEAVLGALGQGVGYQRSRAWLLALVAIGILALNSVALMWLLGQTR